MINWDEIEPEVETALAIIQYALQGAIENEDDMEIDSEIDRGMELIYQLRDRICAEIKTPSRGGG